MKHLATLSPLTAPYPEDSLMHGYAAYKQAQDLPMTRIDLIQYWNQVRKSQ